MARAWLWFIYFANALGFSLSTLIVVRMHSFYANPWERKELMALPLLAFPTALSSVAATFLVLSSERTAFAIWERRVIWIAWAMTAAVAVELFLA